VLERERVNRGQTTFFMSKVPGYITQAFEKRGLSPVYAVY